MSWAIKIFLFMVLATYLQPLQATLQDDHRLEIHNHILWSYRSSVLTLMDVIKYLDQHLERTKSPKMNAQEKHDYYQQNWRPALQELIDNELIYQDGVDQGWPISDAEAKDELVRLYGDQYLSVIDSQGIGLPEAIRLTKKDLLTQRAFQFRVYYQTRNQITPKMVAAAYQDYIKQYPETDRWSYKVITIRGPYEKASLQAQEALNGLQSGKLTLDQLSTDEPGKEDGKSQTGSSDVKLSIGRILEHTSHEINERYLVALQPLTANQPYSSPMDCSRRQEGESQGIFRILVLLSKEHISAPTFSQMQSRLEDDLRRKLSESERIKYITRLHKQFEREQGETFTQIFNPPFTLFTIR